VLCENKTTDISKEKLINNQYSFSRRIFYSTVNKEVEKLVNERTPFSEKLKEAIDVIDEAYEKYGYINE